MFISLRNLLGLRLKSGRNSSREGEWRMKRKRKGRKNRGRRQEAHTWDHTCELESSLVEDRVHETREATTIDL